VCVPKTRFCNIGDEVRQGQAVMCSQNWQNQRWGAGSTMFV
jgi:hypothetical protein